MPQAADSATSVTLKYDKLDISISGVHKLSIYSDMGCARSLPISCVSLGSSRMAGNGCPLWFSAANRPRITGSL